VDPCNDESRKAPQARKEAKKGRFRIVKLEERVAPRVGRYHYPGWYKHGWYGPPGQVRP
jgi:hypothetical protein